MSDQHPQPDESGSNGPQPPEPSPAPPSTTAYGSSPGPSTVGPDLGAAPPPIGEPVTVSTLPPPPGPLVTSGGTGVVRVLIGAAVVIGLVAIAVVALGGLLSASSSTSSTSIEVGDCFAEFSQFEIQPGAGQAEVMSVDTAPCDNAHALEAYYVGPAYDSFEDVYPDSATIDDVAVTSCRQRFERFVATNWDTSVLDFWWLTPSARGWDEGDRDLVCLVGAYDKMPTTGTLKDAGR